MLSQLFSSVFSQASISIDPLMLVISLLVSIGLGLVLASVYKYKTFYSKDFVIMLTVLPALIAVTIFLVNGNLGTSVAVAGTFSLIKFRSPASSAKELLLVFMAMALGLATGMGYLALAVLVTVMICLVMLFLENSGFAMTSKSRRQLTLALPNDLADSTGLHQLLDKCCKSAELLSIKSKKNVIELVYQVELATSDEALLTELLAYNPKIEVSLSKMIKKRKTL